MRVLLRNKVSFYYALYEGKQEVIDEQGFYTGETKLSYTKPIACLANISAAQGRTETLAFGDNLSYDKTMVFDIEFFPPIDESSVLWVDVLPELDDEGNTSTPYDYIVRRVAKSLNGVSVAISKVDVNG